MVTIKNRYGKYVLAIDVGGTHFRSSIFSYDKKLVTKPIKVSTPNFINHPNLEIDKLQSLLVNMIAQTVTDYQLKYPDLLTVGISFPGPITFEGIVRQSSVIWGNKGKNFPIRKNLEKKLPEINFVIANDITAAAERYAMIPRFQNCDFFAVITVSSGIGGKIYDVKNKRVLLDKNSIGGEPGHIIVDFSPNAAVCNCGGRGHLEALASGRAVEKTAQDFAKKNPEEYKKSSLYKIAGTPELIQNELLVKAINENDTFSLKVLDFATFPVSYSISQISGFIGVDKVVIIGGFALNCAEMYIASLRKNMQKVDFYGRSSDEVFNLVEMGIQEDNACLIGIGLLALKSYNKS